MIRARFLKNIHVKRTLKPLYAHHQATPYAAFLDPAVTSSTIIYPGMVARKTTGEMMAVGNNSSQSFGLFANFIHGDLDELGDSTEIGVWRGGPDAVFELLGDGAGSFGALANDAWTGQNGTAGGVRVYSDANGKVTLSSNTNAAFKVGRLIEAPSNKKIIVALEIGTAAGSTV